MNKKIVLMGPTYAENPTSIQEIIGGYGKALELAQ